LNARQALFKDGAIEFYPSLDEEAWIEAEV